MLCAASLFHALHVASSRDEFCSDLLDFTFSGYLGLRELEDDLPARELLVDTSKSLQLVLGRVPLLRIEIDLRKECISARKIPDNACGLA